eukprot:CAMPEP_0203945374 /NCGR_PEP_ID=MMETSP0359-20131031/80905_1 /ASSEMBLY_ACC=CAM_ASM_000338 /TAXON_ID=268821 /ORGANISM="Scrippsiella Hangoei, Strain SHTV-5" /LENGTH=39 /DNA_ID= /DNA_START= /DNA_END= /DNA_ORIENTATION=
MTSMFAKMKTTIKNKPIRKMFANFACCDTKKPCSIPASS